MDYDIEKVDLEGNYGQLDAREKMRLSAYWDELIDFLEDTDRDWIKKKNIEEDKKFRTAYDAFLQVFEPPTSTADSFAFFKMDLEELKNAGELLDLGEDSESITSPVDEYLEGNYER